MVASINFALAASSIFALTSAAPLRRSLVERDVSYQIYAGDGSTAQGWPAKSEWADFDTLWQNNQKLLTSGCLESWSQGKQNDANDIKAIQDGLESASSKTGLPKEFLMAIMMQESRGCVRVITTSYGNVNPGLFQDFNGDATCNQGGQGTADCPHDTIVKMVEQGAGIGLQFGLQQALQQAGGSDAQAYYRAARIYNSGSLDGSGNLAMGVATHCYVTDVANRLKGWAGDSTPCQEGTIQSQQPGQGNPSPPSSPSSPSSTPTVPSPTATQAPSSTAVPTYTPTTPSDTPTIPKQPQKGNTGNNGNNGNNDSNAPKAPGAGSNGCSSWYTIKNGDTCNSISEAHGMNFDSLKQLNSGIDDKCSNLWLGYSYCVGA